jgi:chromosome segregation ATPase
MIGITTKIKLAITGIVSLGVVTIVGYLYYQMVQYERALLEAQNTITIKEADISTLEGNVDGLELALSSQTDAFDRLQERYRAAFIKQQELNDKLSDIRIKHSEVTRELDGYKTRLKNASLKKPKLVQRLANRKLASIMRDVERTTDPETYNSETGGGEGTSNTSTSSE